MYDLPNKYLITFNSIIIQRSTYDVHLERSKVQKNVVFLIISTIMCSSVHSGSVIHTKNDKINLFPIDRNSFEFLTNPNKPRGNCDLRN